MTNPTTPFSWQMPTSTDLVTDLPADFETFGQAVATSMADLLGGTTGQILSKASNTDMDFTWTSANPGDITGVTAGTGISGGGTSGDVTITNSMATAIDAKGDLIGGTGADTFSRLAVGTNGQVLTADSTAATGLAWATASSVPTSYGFTAGKNKIINGDFNINQRSFTSTTTNLAYGFDRFLISYSGGTLTNSAQTFTAGTAPVAGYEGKNFARLVTASQSAAGDYAAYIQRIESVRSFAGETVTISMWAKASTGTPKIGISATQEFGTSGAPSATVIVSGGTATISTSWARYTFTVAIPSIAGKTITTGDCLGITFWTSVGTTISALGYPAVGVQNVTIDTWGWQIESGSTATAFQTATGTIQGELAACQRYYFRSTPGTAYGAHAAWGPALSTSYARIPVNLPVTMRVTPTSIDYANLVLSDGVNSMLAVTAVTFSAYENRNILPVDFTIGSTSLTQYRSYLVNNNNNTAGYLGFSAEL